MILPQTIESKCVKAVPDVPAVQSHLYMVVPTTTTREGNGDNLIYLHYIPKDAGIRPAWQIG
jgi:hypothetical protein